MKRYLLSIILCLWASCAWAFPPGFIGAVASGGLPAACVTPSDGNIVSEGFIGTGFETGTFTRTTGASTADPDYTLPGDPPVTSCTEGYRILHITAGDPLTATYDKSPAISLNLSTTAVDILIDVYIDSWSSFGSQEIVVFDLNEWDPPVDYSVRLSVNNNGSTPSFRAAGATDAYAPFALDTWHRVKIHLDPTNTSCYLQVDGGTQHSFARSDKSNPTRWYIGVVNTGNAYGTNLDAAVGGVWINIP